MRPSSSLKYWFFYVLVICHCLFSCKGGKEAALTGPPEKATYGDKIEFDGLRILHLRNRNEIVSVRLYVLGGTQNYTPAYQGIEHLALLTAVEGGPTGMTEENYLDLLRLNDARISSFSGLEYSTLTLDCPVTNFDTAWSIFTRIILQPAFRAQTFQRIQEREALLRLKENITPTTHIWDLAREAHFKGRYHARYPHGKVGSIQAVSNQQAQEYFQVLMGKQRMVLSVAGNLEKEELVQKVFETLGDLPQGYYEPKPAGAILQNSPTVQIEPRRAAQNYLVGLFEGPPAGHPEAKAMALAMDILESRLIAWQKSGAEGVCNFAAGYRPAEIGYNFISLETSDPEAATQEMMSIVKEFFEEGPQEEEFLAFREALTLQLLNHFFTSTGQAEQMALTEIYQRPESALEWATSFRGLGREESHRVFRKWCGNIAWSYLGNEALIDPDVLKLPIREMK